MVTHLCCKGFGTGAILMRSEIIIDLKDFSRLPEVVAYASMWGVTIPAAIQMLVNAGLSHQ